MVTCTKTLVFDTPWAKATGILGSTSPLRLDPLRYLAQRWFSPLRAASRSRSVSDRRREALTFRVPLGSWSFQNLFDLQLFSGK